MHICIKLRRSGLRRCLPSGARFKPVQVAVDAVDMELLSSTVACFSQLNYIASKMLASVATRLAAQATRSAARRATAVAVGRRSMAAVASEMVRQACSSVSPTLALPHWHLPADTA